MERLEMKTIEYRTQDKSTWEVRGEWDNEPDKVQWKDEATGLPCLIVRGPLGAWCGYVGVSEGHKFFGKDYDDVDADVHGGLTFAKGCSDHSPEAFAKWSERVPSWRKEAAQFPVGDAARRLKEWAGCLENYDEWKARMEARSICHVPEAGESDRVWWFGFDCAHLGDLIPGMDDRYGNDYDNTYKGVNYVRQEVTKLAAQLITRAPVREPNTVREGK